MKVRRSCAQYEPTEKSGISRNPVKSNFSPFIGCRRLENGRKKKNNKGIARQSHTLTSFMYIAIHTYTHDDTEWGKNSKSERYRTEMGTGVPPS